MSARLSDLTLAEIAQRSRRYRPLVLTVVVTLGILRALPEPGSTADEPLQVAAPAAAIAPPAASTPKSDGIAPTPVPRPDLEAAPILRVAPFAPPVSAGPSSPAQSPPPTAAPAPLPSSPPTQPELAAPRVVHTGWATRTAGTPAGAVGVPDGSLPVGNRLGQTSKASFVRLAGEWPTLSVQVDPDGTSGIGDPAVRACAITTESWEPESAAAFEEAPTWGDDCVAGAVDGAGVRWTFEVGAIDYRFGVALVPAPDAPVEFQIAFRTPA